jgi:hypothetical protein
MVKRKKYGYGSKIKIETPAKALAQNDIDVAKSQNDSAMNPWIQGSQMLGQLGMMATAGNVPGGEYLAALNQFTQLMAMGGQVNNYPPQNRDDGADIKLQDFKDRSATLNDKNKSINWVNRGLNPDKNLVINNDDGSVSTHRLTWGEDDKGNAFVYPTIVQDQDGKLRELNQKEAWSHAMKNKTAISFGKDYEFADFYSQNGLIDHTKEFALGGQVQSNIPVEVEGGEVGQTPQGEMLEFNGQSHEQGGIKTELPEGTEIYSRRIKVEGKTLAERKKERETNLKKFDKLLTKGFDPLAEKSKARTQVNNAKVDEFDTQLQGIASKAMGGEPQKFAYGTGPGDPMLLALQAAQQYGTSNFMNTDVFPDYSNSADLTNEALAKSNENLGLDVAPTKYKKANSYKALPTPPTYGEYLTRNGEYTNELEGIRREQGGPNYLDNPQLKMFTPTIKGPSNTKIGSVAGAMVNNYIDETKPKIKEGLKTVKDSVENADFAELLKSSMGNLPNLTSGDALGIGASLAQSFLPLRNTLNERATDTVNPNYYENFGDDALRTMEDTEGQVTANFESQVDRLARSKRTSQAQNNLGARGVNQKRALNIAGEQQYQDSYNQAFSAYNQQLAGMMQNKAQFQSTIDQIQMGGEKEADISNRQDKASFYTKRGEDLMAMTEGLQSVAGNLNEGEYRETMTKLINTLKDVYGIEVDMKGNVKANPKKTVPNVIGTTPPDEIDNDMLARLMGMNTQVQGFNTGLKYGK